jgi:hypothetical protein
VQVGGWQWKFTHTPLLQSALTPHSWFGLQGPQEPPQSVSVSSPFFTPSLQLGI